MTWKYDILEVVSIVVTWCIVVFLLSANCSSNSLSILDYISDILFFFVLSFRHFNTCNSLCLFVLHLF